MSWTADKVRALITSPCCAIEISPSWLDAHPPDISEEDWIKANVRVIEEVGAECWLRGLLDGLKFPPDDEGIPRI